MKLFSPHESARAGTDWPDPEILPEDQIWMNDWAERLSASERGGGGCRGVAVFYVRPGHV